VSFPAKTYLKCLIKDMVLNNLQCWRLQRPQTADSRVLLSASKLSLVSDMNYPFCKETSWSLAMSAQYLDYAMQKGRYCSLCYRKSVYWFTWAREGRNRGPCAKVSSWQVIITTINIQGTNYNGVEGRAEKGHQGSDCEGLNAVDGLCLLCSADDTASALDELNIPWWIFSWNCFPLCFS